MRRWKRPGHDRVAEILGNLDADFLLRANCYFGGGTQIVLANGEYRESRDVDFICSSRDGFRILREAVREVPWDVSSGGKWSWRAASGPTATVSGRS